MIVDVYANKIQINEDYCCRESHKISTIPIDECYKPIDECYKNDGFIGIYAKSIDKHALEYIQITPYANDLWLIVDGIVYSYDQLDNVNNDNLLWFKKTQSTKHSKDDPSNQIKSKQNIVFILAIIFLICFIGGILTAYTSNHIIFIVAIGFSCGYLSSWIFNQWR